MVGRINHNKKKVIIIGGGISGLSFGYFAKKNGFNVTIYEAKDRIGGWINSHNSKFGLIQEGAHIVKLADDDALKEISKDLNIDLQQIKTNNKFILKNNKITKNPFTKIEIIKLFLKLFNKKVNYDADNLEDFCNKNFPQEIINNIIYPMIYGIYACPLNKLDHNIVLKDAIAQNKKTIIGFIKELSKKHKTSKNFTNIYSPKDGMAEIISKLGEYLKDEIVLNKEIKSIGQLGADITNSNIIITCPANNVSSIFRTICKESTDVLNNIEYTTLVTGTFFIRKINSIPDGMGFLSSKTDDGILGMFFNSQSFDNRVNKDHENIDSYTMFFEYKNELSEDDYINLFTNKISQITGDNPYIYESKITIYKNAIPIYNKEVSKLLNLQKSWFNKEDGRVLFGNYTGSLSVKDICNSVRDMFKN
jgi:oxygen-dependent protoporphyrinogen oxidase